jgi:hypothetical protein
METQNADAVYAQTISSRRAQFRPQRWLAGVVALTLVVGLGTIACSQLGQPQNTPSVPVPSAGHWVQVLTGYSLTSLKAARSDPAVIYACATRYRQAGNARTPIGNAFLRSADFGAHWQNIGSKLVLGITCQFAINPADSNDLYFMTVSNNRQGSSVILHSADGGQTWNAITPVFQIPGLKSPLVWAPQQLEMEGNQLFALQAVPPGTLSLPGQSTPPSRYPSLLHLLTSVDGGYNWTVLDNYLNSSAQDVRSYAVDPSSIDTIYEVVSGPVLPIQPVGRPQSSGTPIPVPRITPGSALYKTTDGGSNWQLLQQGLPIATQVQLAIDKPNLLYLGSTSGGAHPLQPSGIVSPNTTGSTFQLNVSSNGGATWSSVALPPSAAHVQRWFVGADGHVYLETGAYITPPVVITVTAVGVRRIKPTPQSTPTQGLPDIRENPATASDTPTPTPGDIPIASTVTVPGTPSVPAPLPTTIQAYDPTSGNWSAVPAPLSNVLLLMVTPAGSKNSAVMWLIGINNGTDVVYRNVI